MATIACSIHLDEPQTALGKTETVLTHTAIAKYVRILEAIQSLTSFQVVSVPSPYLILEDDPLVFSLFGSNKRKTRRLGTSRPSHAIM